MTWEMNAGNQTPLERYDSFEDAKTRFEELRVQDYNNGETPRRDGLFRARLTREIGYDRSDYGFDGSACAVKERVGVT